MAPLTARFQRVLQNNKDAVFTGLLELTEHHLYFWTQVAHKTVCQKQHTVKVLDTFSEHEAFGPKADCKNQFHTICSCIVHTNCFKPVTLLWGSRSTDHDDVC